jgi:hypothetical protein
MIVDITIKQGGQTMTDYTLLKEFLESDMTQKDFSKSKNIDNSFMNKKLWRQLMTLYKENIIMPGQYGYEVRYAKRHKEEILKAISKL